MFLIALDSYHYLVSKFTDAAGETRYGLSVTIREVLDDASVEELLDLRNRCKAIRTIQKFFSKVKEKRSNPGNKNKKGGFFNQIFRPSGPKDEKENLINLKARESYETMLENGKLGDVCVTEICFIFIGTNEGEQSLMLCALKQLLQLHRIKKQMSKIYERALQSSTIVDDGTSAIKRDRHWLLHRIQTKLYLSLHERRVKYPSDENDFINRTVSNVVFDQLFANFPKISLPLPLPDMIDEWGVAQLFLRFDSSILLIILNLLLLESSVLVIGTKAEEVSCCTSALLTLLKPFKWSSVFIPLIPNEFIDFVGSPVPFIAGIVPENKLNLKNILVDDRVSEAINDGMIVLNLDAGSTHAASQLSGQSKLAFSQTLVSHGRILQYEKRLKRLIENDTSALLSFTKFFEQGASAQEALTIQSLKQVIRDSFSNNIRFDFNDEDQWKKFSDFDEVTRSYVFNPSKLIPHYRNQYKFLDCMIKTQLFIEYLQGRTNKIKSDDPNALFIADWLSFKWKRRNKSSLKF